MEPVSERQTPPVAQRAAAVVAGLTAAPLPPGLYLVATPIGNLADVTLRALSVLQRADLICCEDTRHSRTLLSHYGISRPLRAYHEHSAERERPHLLAELALGKSIALISDAGTPLVSDPGYKLVRAALDAGHAVVSLPGPSAVLAALASTGLPTDTFVFAGFLPARGAARLARVRELQAVPATLVFFESPGRLSASLQDIAAALGDREAAVARELTKLHEEVKRGTPAELALWAQESAPKGEVVIVVGPPRAEPATDAEILAQLETLLGDTSLRDAAKAVAERLGVPKARVYDLGIGLKQRQRK
jgi:16S rRNA (cytidine1402-2'-O)-methyltransferase